VVATGGEPYLHTPEDDLPWLVRHSIDTAAAWAALLAAAAGALALALCAAGRAWAATARPGIKAKAA